MARKKFKMTGFARFFLVMLILAPAAYIGASYYNGEDGIENFKNLFSGIFTTENTSSETTKPMDKVPANSNDNSSASDDTKDQKIKELEERNEVLKEALEQKTKELEDLKAKLEALTNPG